MSSHPVVRWLQLTVLFTLGFVAVMAFVAGPFRRGEWFPPVMALVMGALVAYKWMHPGSGSDDSDDEDDDAGPRINPGTGLPMAGNGMFDVGGNAYGASLDDN
jgi:hypothetical protein